MTKVVIIGGGPGGYEAALVGAQLGGEVTLVERAGVGGAAVLTDCVPSKTLIATAEVLSTIHGSGELGIYVPGADDPRRGVRVDLAQVNRRVLALAHEQSSDIRANLERSGVRIINGSARLTGPHDVVVDADGGEDDVELHADVILLATGTTPRVLPDARPDGERILSWTQLYNLQELPERLIVVGSGVTGAEFASAYQTLGSQVVLVSSRDQVLPSEDADAAAVLQDVLERRGMEVRPRSRAVAARRDGDEVVVTLSDGDEVRGTHCLMAVGAIPNTEGIGLEDVGVALKDSGHVQVDRVSRTSAPGIYAAGDCTGVLPLASVAAMQGRIAMWHALGDAVPPLRLETVASNVFTSPEIAHVGASQADIDAGLINGRTLMLPFKGNARAKMQGVSDGFVKLFCRPSSGLIIGGVVVAPHASELIHAISVAVEQAITVDEFTRAFTVYPSLSGSLAEAARKLHQISGYEFR